MPTVKRLKRRPAFTFPTLHKSPFIVNGLHVVKHGPDVVGLGQVNAILVQSGVSTYEVVGTVEQWIVNTTTASIVLTFPSPYADYHEGAATVALRPAVNRLPWPLDDHTDPAGVAGLRLKRVKPSPAAPPDFLAAVHVARGNTPVGSFAYTRSVSSLQLITNANSVPALGDERQKLFQRRKWMEGLYDSAGEPLARVYAEYPDTTPSGGSWTSRTRVTQVWPTNASNPDVPLPTTIDTGPPKNTNPASRAAWFAAALAEFKIPATYAGGFIEAWVHQYDALPTQMPTD